VLLDGDTEPGLGQDLQQAMEVKAAIAEDERRIENTLLEFDFRPPP
jgi:hypothetical protein